MVTIEGARYLVALNRVVLGEELEQSGSVTGALEQRRMAARQCRSAVRSETEVRVAAI